MKRFSLLYLIVILILSIGGLYAQSFTITYMSGDAFLLSQGEEEYLDIGSSVSRTDRILIEDDTVVELEGSGKSLTLTGPGTYELASVLGQAQKRENTPLSNLLGNRISRLISDDSVVNPSSVMGVRGAAQDETELTWLSGESEAFIGTGREKLQQGDVTGALDTFTEGLEIARDFGEIESEMELTFLVSYSQALSGNPGPALNTLKTIEANPYAPWYAEYRLYHAQLLLNSGNPVRAAGVLQQNEKILPLEREEEKLLLGISLYESGSSDRQKGTAMLKSISSGNSEAARVAAAYLKN